MLDRIIIHEHTIVVIFNWQAKLQNKFRTITRMQIGSCDLPTLNLCQINTVDLQKNQTCYNLVYAVMWHQVTLSWNTNYIFLQNIESDNYKIYSSAKQGVCGQPPKEQENPPSRFRNSSTCLVYLFPNIIY